VKFLWRTAQDVRHALLQETKFLYHISSRADTKGGADTDGTTEVSIHALRPSRLVNGRGDNNYNRPAVRGFSRKIRHCHMDGRDDVSRNALLCRRRLSYDVRTTQKEWERSLLNFVRGADTA